MPSPLRAVLTLTLIALAASTGPTAAQVPEGNPTSHERCLSLRTPDALEGRVGCRPALTAEGPAPVSAVTPTTEPLSARIISATSAAATGPASHRVDHALTACLGSGVADTLERKVPGCRVRLAAAARRQEALAECLGTGTPDALERRGPRCRAAVAASSSEP